MDISTAQQEMRAGYAGGAPGVLVSGLVWLVAGFVWASMGIASSFLALFIGGMAIFPVSTIIAQKMMGAPKIGEANALNRLGLESTFVLMAGILIGYVLLARQPELAIPAVSLIMGARYFVFATVYGRMIFWALGGAICAAGTLALLGITFLPGNVAFHVGAIELIFAGLLFARR